ncbi:hypothetical protein GCM10009631_02140 [Corynebacterium glaucum]|uniref:hypothetical protein n=1 Tax=Corynebacterium glaucum TaxID=187491 RepID=UPI0031DE8771
MTRSRIRTAGVAAAVATSLIVAPNAFAEDNATTAAETVDAQNVEQQTPKEDTPKEDTPKEDTPKEDTPKEDTPKEDTPKEDTPKEDTPKEDTPKEDTPKEDTPKEDTPKEEEKEPKGDRSSNNTIQSSKEGDKTAKGSSEDGSLSPGAIAGIVIGVLAAIAGAAAFALPQIQQFLPKF